MTPERFLQDLRFGWRLLRRIARVHGGGCPDPGAGDGRHDRGIQRPGPAWVLRPLPYAEPDRPHDAVETNGPRSLLHERLSPVNFGDYRALTQVFDAAAAWWCPQINLTESAVSRCACALSRASANFFQVIGSARPGRRIRLEPLSTEIRSP